MHRAMMIMLMASLTWGCGNNNEDPDLCASKECGEMCSEQGETERYCDPEGLCRNFSGDEEYTYCDMPECTPCGASCQSPCPLGALCGYEGPGFCNPEGECIIVYEDNAPRPFACPDGTK
jgi:hypothetical protein